MRGKILELEVDSQALTGNPLGDPSVRRLLVYVPACGAAGRPAAYFLHGFTGNGRSWLGAAPFGPTVPERIDALVEAGVVPPLVGVFPDGETSLGGTQWIDAPSVGAYQSYVAIDVVATVERELGTLPRREARAAIGKSSGGYGALCMARDRADVFAHVACHSGDAYFEYAYLGDFPRTAGVLLANGGDLNAFLAGVKRRARETRLLPDDIPTLNVLAMAANYAPDPHAPLRLALPFEIETGRIKEREWLRWLVHDPVRFVPHSLAAFRKLATVFVDCGTRDEYHLRWGARMVGAALRDGGVEVFDEEFEDGHRGIDYRYEASLRVIGPRLLPG